MSLFLFYLKRKHQKQLDDRNWQALCQRLFPDDLAW